MIGLGGYVFIRKDAIIDNVKGKVMEAVTEKLGGLGDLGGGALGGSLGLPAPSNPIAAPSDPTPTEPVLPLGF